MACTLSLAMVRFVDFAPVQLFSSPTASKPVLASASSTREVPAPVTGLNPNVPHDSEHCSEPFPSTARVPVLRELMPRVKLRGSVKEWRCVISVGGTLRFDLGIFSSLTFSDMSRSALVSTPEPSRSMLSKR